jgi:hypothetical protein
MIKEWLTWNEISGREMPAFVLDERGTAMLTVLNMRANRNVSLASNIMYSATVLNYATGEVEIFSVSGNRAVLVLVPDLGDALAALASQFKIEFIEE